MIKEVAIDLIPKEQRLNYRELDLEFVTELSERYRRNGYDDYPVDVVYDVADNLYYLWDGNHRITAAETAGCETIKIKESAGLKADADRLLATHSNILQDKQSCVRVTADAKLQRAEQALQAEFTSALTLGEVAEIIRVSIATVRNAKANLNRRGVLTSKERRAKDLRKAVWWHIHKNPADTLKSVAERFGMRRPDVAAIKREQDELKAEMDALYFEMQKQLIVDAFCGDVSRLHAAIQALKKSVEWHKKKKANPDYDAPEPSTKLLPRPLKVRQQLEDEEERLRLEAAAERWIISERKRLAG